MTIRAKQDLRVVFVNDGVEFAVINGGVALHDSRALVDGTPVGIPAPAVMGPVRLLAGLLAAQGMAEAATLTLVPEDILVSHS